MENDVYSSPFFGGRKPPPYNVKLHIPAPLFLLTVLFNCDILTVVYIMTEKKMNILDTIAAISTPFGKGGIAVIRISGADAFSVADRIFKPENGKSLKELSPKTAYYGKIFHEGRQIDDGIVTLFSAPNSFCGEDTAEISCHGGILITQMVLTAALSSGARLATAGEFTRRAFINGKMKLSHAEALGNLLEAETQEQVYLARSGMRGTLSAEVDGIYNSLCLVLSSVFAHIDYPDEDLADMSREQMVAVIDGNISRLERLCKTYKTGRAVAEGIKTAIAGRTNAGKSSLYNRILGRNAAIVTDIEGTTRDILTEKVMLGRVLIKLSDTAGLRQTGDAVEKIGIERARESIEDSELILAVFDGSTLPTDEDYSLAAYLKEQSAVTVAIINKTDRGICPEAEKLCSSFEYSLRLSTLNGDGFDKLSELVESIYIDKNLDTGNDAIIANSRQHASASACLECLIRAKEFINSSLPLEICCSELESAMSALSELDGRKVSEDIVAGIFKNFCVGK